MMKPLTTPQRSLIASYVKYAKATTIIGEFAGCPYLRVVDDHIEWKGGTRVRTDRVRTFYISSEGKTLHAPPGMMRTVDATGLDDRDIEFLQQYMEQLA